MNKLYQTDLEKHACEVFSNSLNEINNNAYKDKYLLANPLLSRNPYINNLLNRIYKREKAKGKVLLSTVAKKVILYYIKSFALVFLWLAKKTAFHLSGYKNNRYAKSIKNQTELVVVDIFSVVDNIKKNNFRDRNYLRGLDTILERNNVPYIYAPIFYGSHNPLKFYSIFKKIQTTNIDYITDFELFQITEIIKIIKFILVYPWKVLNLCKSLNNSGNINKLIQEELVNTLATTWHNYARRLMGEKLSNLHPKIKVLSWDESQVIHKNFYRGLRDGSGIVNIIGCQFFLRHSIWVNLGVSEQEIKLGLVPNKILTNGKENILCSGLKYEPGVSLRYLDLFDQPINSNGDDLKSLVLLSYFEKESYNLLRLVSKSTCSEDFLIKPHPALNLDSMNHLIKNNWRKISGNLYDYLKDSQIVITSASGTAVEAIAMGVSVILVGEKDSVISNPMMPLGKDKMWGISLSSEELPEKINTLLKFRKENKGQIIEIAKLYRENLFNNPSPHEIKEMFEL